LSKLVFAINVSLDGCADHTVAIADDELHDFYARWMEAIGAVLFGRITYQLLESYWPQAPEDPHSTPSEVAFAGAINAVPKVVFSKTLREVSWNNTRLVNGDMVKEVARLKQEGGKAMSVGGISLIRTLLNLGMIDEYWLLIHPLIWGQGRRLFEGVTERHAARLADSMIFRSGVVVLHYIPVREKDRKKGIE